MTAITLQGLFEFKDNLLKSPQLFKPLIKRTSTQGSGNAAGLQLRTGLFSTLQRRLAHSQGPLLDT